jgi:hypothetical protein
VGDEQAMADEDEAVANEETEGTEVAAYGEADDGSWTCPRCVTLERLADFRGVLFSRQAMSSIDNAVYHLGRMRRSAGSLARMNHHRLEESVSVDLATSTAAMITYITAVFADLMDGLLIDPSEVIVRDQQAGTLCELSQKRFEARGGQGSRPTDGMAVFLEQCTSSFRTSGVLDPQALKTSVSPTLSWDLLAELTPKLLAPAACREWAKKLVDLAPGAAEQRDEQLVLLVAECIVRDLTARLVISYTRDSIAAVKDAQASTHKKGPLRARLSHPGNRSSGGRFRAAGEDNGSESEDADSASTGSRARPRVPAAKRDKTGTVVPGDSPLKKKGKAGRRTK